MARIDAPEARRAVEDGEYGSYGEALFNLFTRTRAVRRSVDRRGFGHP